MRLRTPLLICCVTAAIVLQPLSSLTARADVIFHNGTVATSGDGSVNVDLFWLNSPGGLLFGTAFHELAVHSMLYEYDAVAEPPVFLAEFAISNETGASWDNFYISLLQADFHGVNGGVPGPLARTINPVVPGGTGSDEISFAVNTGTVTLAGSEIFRDSVNSILRIDFADSVDPGESIGVAFFVDISQGGQGPQFLLSQLPTTHPIPSPGSAALALPAMALLWLRRRCRSAC